MFRDKEHAKLDAILARYAPSQEQKLNKALDHAHYLIACCDLMGRSDDANFVEADHPRDATGKFTSAGNASGAASHGIIGYEKTLKKGAKGSVAGIMKHMLLSGNYSKNDIFTAAQTIYGLSDDKKGYVDWYKKDLLKKGEKVPEIPAVSKVGQEQKAAEGPTETAKPAAAPPTPKIGAAEVLSTNQSGMSDKEKIQWYEEALASGKVDPKAAGMLKGLLESTKEEVAKYAPKAPTPKEVKAKASEPAPATPTDKKTLQQKVAYHLPTKAVNTLAPVFEHFDKLTEENKPKVEYKLKELVNALAENESDTDGAKAALAKIEPIQGAGLSVAAVNDALAQVKSFFKAGSPADAPAAAPAYEPSTPAQKKVYDKLKAIPHFRTDHVNYFEDHSGKELKAVLKTDTRKIKGDFYAKVSSAYAGNKGDGNTASVHQAMDSYRAATKDDYSSDEQTAMQRYKGSDYREMNKALLKGSDGEGTIGKWNKDFREAVNKSVCPADTPVFRGLSCSLKSLTGFDDPEKGVGRCFEHVNFASCSRDMKISKAFGSNVLLKFTIAAGTKSIVLGSQVGEKEVVLPDKGIFRIDKVEAGGAHGVKHLVHVTYLGTKENE
jgi:hypothetical protein